MVPNRLQMPRQRDENSGKYRTAYTDQEFIDAIRKRDQPSTIEIADALGCANRTALLRLHDLADEGAINRRKIGTVNLWSVADE